MKDGKIFAMFFNASPRKNWNTAKMLEAAAEGARGAGAETETVNLYDFPFAGCKSCFACKLKNAKTNGVCALRDDLRPILERAHRDTQFPKDLEAARALGRRLAERAAAHAD